MELLERFQGGDQGAFEELFRRHQGEVYGWIIRMVRSPDVAEDLTVEAFWRIYRARRRFDPTRPFAPWARRIATNVALDYFKLERRQSVSNVIPEECPAAPRQGSTEIREIIRRVFLQLPVKLRIVATLGLVEGAPQAEIASALGITLEAVKSRQFRAVHLLREKLERYGMMP